MSQLKEAVTELGMPTFTAKQIAGWLYGKRVHSIDEMTNISLANRQRLSDAYEVGTKFPCKVAVSKDGTRKYLFEIIDGRFIEAVYIPEKDRATLCVSSQMGCQMNCAFCATGQQGFAGNLTSADILSQIIGIDEFDSLSNLVFMGMGEPLNNLDEVLSAIDVICSDWGLGWSPKRITVSTVGITPRMEEFIARCSCNLAISLHAAIKEVRAAMIPAEKAYPVADLIALLKRYDWSHQRRLSFEYTMFGGINDGPDALNRLIALIRGLDCHVNLIPYHPTGNDTFRPSPARTMEMFEEKLNNSHIPTTIRRSRGQDIDAACGMLSTKEQKK